MSITIPKRVRVLNGVTDPLGGSRENLVGPRNGISQIAEIWNKNNCLPTPDSNLRAARYSPTTVTLSNPSSSVGARSLAAMRSTTSAGTTRSRPRLRSRQTASGTSKKTASTPAP